MARFGNPNNNDSVNYNVPVGEDIRLEHDNDPPIIKMFLEDLKGFGKGFGKGLTTDTLGAPVDISSMISEGIGVPISESFKTKEGHIIGGSNSIRSTFGLNTQETDSPSEQFGVNASALNPASLLKGSVVLGAGILRGITPSEAAKFGDLIRKGATPEELYDKYRVTQSPIGSSRVDLDDRNAHLSRTASSGVNSSSRFLMTQRFGSADKFLEHSELFNDPVIGKELKDTRIVLRRDAIDGTFVEGSFSEADNTIYLYPRKDSTDRDIVATALHELQHKAQSVQNLEFGANANHILSKIRNNTLSAVEKQAADKIRAMNPNIFDNEVAMIIYMSHAGEVEARAVAAKYLGGASLFGKPPKYDTAFSEIIDRGDELARIQALRISAKAKLGKNSK